MLMQEETVRNANIPQGEHIRTGNQISGLNENRPEVSSFNRKKEVHGREQFYSRESMRRKMILKFAKIVGVMVGVFLLAGTIAILIISGSPNKDNNDLENTSTHSSPLSSQQPGEANGENKSASAEPSDSISLPPLKTNFLVVGKDAGDLLTDVIMVGCFDRDTCDIDIISIPRDTLTIIPPTRLKRMNELGLYPPSDGTMKINAVNSYGRENYGIALLEQQLQDMLGIEIEYQIEIDLQAFRNIVDDLGGVYFEVPKPGMYYDDPYQNLHIAIPPGFQYLDGKNAEGLVRYRATYRDGDIQRIGVQQEFLKALFSQVLERENILGNAFSITKAIIGYTKTNFSLTDIPKYLRYINNVSPDKIHFHTLPCVPQYIGDVSYVIPHEEQIKELVNDIFYKVSVVMETPADVTEPPQTSAPVQSSIGLRIEVLNGSGITGIAGAYKDKLENDGFTVTKIDSYTGVQMDKTQIIVRSAGMGSDLVQYFKDAIIQVTPDMPVDYDIIIITGRGES